MKLMMQHGRALQRLHGSAEEWNGNNEEPPITSFDGFYGSAQLEQLKHLINLLDLHECGQILFSAVSHSLTTLHSLSISYLIFRAE
jgi:hypothetical protein